MHIVVCIKSVVRAAPDGVGRRTPENSQLNPFDRPALEAALQLKVLGGGSVTALSMGPAVAGEALGEALAMGADQAVLVSDPALAGSDTLATARVLAAGIARLAPYEFILFGMRSADSDTGQVGPQTATLLGIPFLGGARQVEQHGDVWRIRRIIDDWEESWEMQPPIAATIHPRFFRPRPIALDGITRAYDRPDVQKWSLSGIGLAAERAGLAGSPTRVEGLRKIKRDRSCRMIEGEPRQQAESLIEQLTARGFIAS